ncbi:CRISPR-associated RAMP Cmr1 family protein [Paenibacillus larvae subsp. larvae]|uniref:CRISPR-associated RAMP Cmr1 family protein n=3 Tax=Paenibacillus larvae TaxID=1464 RepID=A0A2L1TVK2_9BACL|nr:type III-B CRISPR module RAMP protein Cmr1 [Paenibacillus larvae]AQT85396.1 type III-B CRISPR module RAMP protein Cmr1 [Paenibacillus larvae subsp. pulvifaciens]AQZ47397.1 type III-B CRISPR module RAMP protein Cmr1 [Paenibacillus larvae subsp. pulvifaciens]AVF24720.1 CRISPR-associated RAMP Cmr1 family protein [Paenibacillus larvae subsp. larvae]AVF29481.1 CRISPR-associated RAMP Cmr1 family protein [Paenibacillus larvae subsp. larvae]MBH0344691.1 hypothetical protein [Paenibacillus larvae]
MEKHTIHCEIITPMFSSGADRDKAELRAPELKALMRYVYRIASKTIKPKELYEQETRLFGNAQHHASPIRLQVIDKGLPKRNKALLLHKNSKEVECFSEGGAFDIVLRKFLSKGEDLQFYQNLIVLSLILGGLGKRSRRGRGCFVMADSGEYTPYLTLPNLLPWITEQLNLMNGQAANSEHRTYVFEQGKIIVHPKAKVHWNQYTRPVIEEIRLGQPIPKTESFLKKVDIASHKIKSTYPSERNLFATGYAGKGRLASSLLVSVTRTSDGQLLPIYTFVKAVVNNRNNHQTLDIDHEERNTMISFIEGRT